MPILLVGADTWSMSRKTDSMAYLPAMLQILLHFAKPLNERRIKKPDFLNRYIPRIYSD
jgi:hypothetical protein